MASIIKRLLGETSRKPLSEASQDMRFDLNARVEVWVSMDDLSQDQRIDALRASSEPLEQKIAQAKAVAEDLARKKLTEIEGQFGVEITADFNAESVNLDRINWSMLVTPQSDDADPQD